MERILIAIDSEGINRQAVLFGCHLARLTQSKLTAVLLEDLAPSGTILIGQETTEDATVTSIAIGSVGESPVSEATRQTTMAEFRALTAEEGIPASIYLDKGVPAEDIVMESRFADLLIVDADTFSSADEGTPSSFVKQVLHDAACPVLIAPEAYSLIGNIVFCYDGSKSSLFAIKQFAYLFPELASQRIKVISLQEEMPSADEQARLTVWLRSHYSDVEWAGAGVEAAGALFSYLLKKKDDIVVMGSYGHGLLASFFEPDYESGILRNTSVPIFVAHS
ncbi:MAG TPA: universal stress protein [Puia sp.]|nr:universal stress protein [Puia sp.]